MNDIYECCYFFPLCTYSGLVSNLSSLLFSNGWIENGLFKSLDDDVLMHGNEGEAPNWCHCEIQSNQQVRKISGGLQTCFNGFQFNIFYHIASQNSLHLHASINNFHHIIIIIIIV